MAELEFGNRDNIFNMAQAFTQDGKVLNFAHNLVEVNDLVRDMPALPTNEGNLAFRGARWDSLPAGTFIALGDGVTAQKGTLQSYREVIGILQSRYQVPVMELQAMGGPAEMAKYREKQIRAHHIGMSQGLSNALINGAAGANHEKLDGLFQRAPWNSIANTEYVFDAGGTGATLRSALLVKPGPETFTLLYPKDHPQKGIVEQDKGEEPVTVTTTDANGTSNAVRYDLVTMFNWWVGWQIENQKAIKRIVNIPITFATLTETIIRKIFEARYIHTIISSMADPQSGNAEYRVEAPWYLYVDPYVFIQLASLKLGRVNVQYSVDNPWKISQLQIDDIIIRRMETLNANESQLVT